LEQIKKEFIRDLKTSYTQVWDGTAYKSINPGVLGPENARVLAGRAGADIAGFIGSENLLLDFVGEFALSKDDYYSLSYYLDLDPENPDDPGELKLNIKPEKLDGKAILVQALAGWQSKDILQVKLNADYIMNDSGWYNPLAQSPSFFARRIANSDKDGDLLKYGARSPFYSTFDALYHFIPKFTPVSKDLMPGSPGKGKCTDGGHCPTDSYDIAPFPKNSYNTAVYTRDELNLLQALADPVLQGTLPNGLATANRAGAQLRLTAGYGKDNMFELQGLFAALEEAKAFKALGDKKAKFNELGGGGKADLGSFLWDSPLEFSGSYKNSKTERGDIKFESNFINAGFYARYFKRFGFAAGFQQIDTKSKNPSAKEWHLESGKQNQWMVGLDYSLAKNAWVAINYGQIIVKNNYYALDPENAEGLLPVYLVKAREEGIIPETQKELKHNFQQNLVEASINVDF
jgi:hypothetical protein